MGRFLPERNISEMRAVLLAAPAAATSGGYPVAVTIAVAATALVAIGMVVVMLRRTMRPTGLTVGISVASVLAVLVGALLVGGSITQPPTAAATPGDTAPKGVSVFEKPVVENLDGLQLPTL